MSESTLIRRKRPVETDAGYAAARLRGMKSHLLDPAFFDRMIEAPDVQELIRLLMETGYEEDLDNELIHGRTSAVVDAALTDNLVRTYQKVLGFLDAKSQQHLVTILGRWDLFNIKTILRGAHNHVPADEIRTSLIPAGFLTQVELDALVRIDDVRAVVDTLAMWGVMYASPLRSAFPEYARTGSLAELELAADRAYAQWAAERAKGRGGSAETVRKILGIQIDVLNLVMVLRMLKADLPVREIEHYFLEGGKTIRDEMFVRLAQLSDVDEVLDSLKRTPYSEQLDGVAVRFLEMGSLSVFERALEEYLTRKALQSGIRDPQGVGVAISYLWGKQNEITNIRIVVKGKDVGMPADRVRAELIRV